MGEAWIEGRDVSLSEAVTEAARLLASSRLPVVTGLGADVAGTRAAVLLAERLHGVVDTAHSNFVLRDLDVLRESGMMLTTPNEAYVRADTLLLVGAGLVDAWPDLPARLLAPRPHRGGANPRRVIWLCPGAAERRTFATEATMLGAPSELPVLLAVLRARVAGRPVRPARVPLKILDKLAADLQAARFGIAVWSAQHVDVLCIEMLCGLVSDLNAGTRFTGLPLAPGDNALGATQVCGWMTGFPGRTSFARGYPEHAPWRCDAERLAHSGEADCAVWIGAYGAPPPAWLGRVPTVALISGDRPDPCSRVDIRVGRPGVDHDAVEHSSRTGTLTAVTAQAASDRVSVAGALGRIAAALPAGG